MPSTKDYKKDNNRGLFGLFKGKPGKGKSVAALSFPNSYVFDFDRKMPAISLKHYPEKEVSWDNFKNIFDLRDKMVEFQRHCPYETLIFDSVTSLSTLCLNSIGTSKGEDVMKMLQNPIKTAKGELSVDVMGIDYYNGEANFFERFLVETAGILYARNENPKHVIFLAHILTVEQNNMLKPGVIQKSSSIVTAGKKAAISIEKAFDENYTFNIIAPTSFDPAGTSAKFICNTQSYDEDMSRTSYNFPAQIDFTNKNFYDILNSYAHFDEKEN